MRWRMKKNALNLIFLRHKKQTGYRLVICNPLIFMVGVAGFELATPCTPCKCATRLRYTPELKIIA